MNRSRFVLAPLLFVMLTACSHATIRKAQSLDTTPPRTVAVMPTDPAGAPPEVSQYVRNLLGMELQRRGYQVPPNERVDPAIQPNATPAQIAEAAKADAVLYTRVTQYSLDRSLFNTRTTFGLWFQLVDPQGGELWIAGLTAADDSSDHNPIYGGGAAGAVIGLAVDAANANVAAERPPFADVAAHVVRQSLRELPHGPMR